MIRGNRSSAGIACQILAVDIREDRVTAAEIEDQSLMRAFAEGIALRARARMTGATSDRAAI